MKRAEQKLRLRNMSLAELQAEAKQLEKSRATVLFAVRFGQSSNVARIRAVKRQLARTLTIAREAQGRET